MNSSSASSSSSRSLSSSSNRPRSLDDPPKELNEEEMMENSVKLWCKVNPGYAAATVWESESRSNFRFVFFFSVCVCVSSNGSFFSFRFRLFLDFSSSWRIVSVLFRMDRWDPEEVKIDETSLHFNRTRNRDSTFYEQMAVRRNLDKELNKCLVGAVPGGKK